MQVNNAARKSCSSELFVRSNIKGQIEAEAAVFLHIFVFLFTFLTLMVTKQNMLSWVPLSPEFVTYHENFLKKTKTVKTHKHTSLGPFSKWKRCRKRWAEFRSDPLDRLQLWPSLGGSGAGWCGLWRQRGNQRADVGIGSSGGNPPLCCSN